jgi:hypothetical protein
MIIHHTGKAVVWFFVSITTPEELLFVNWLQAFYLRQLIGLLTSAGISESKAYTDKKDFIKLNH